MNEFTNHLITLNAELRRDELNLHNASVKISNAIMSNMAGGIRIDTDPLIEDQNVALAAVAATKATIAVYESLAAEETESSSIVKLYRQLDNAMRSHYLAECELQAIDVTIESTKEANKKVRNLAAEIANLQTAIKVQEIRLIQECIGKFGHNFYIDDAYSCYQQWDERESQLRTWSHPYAVLDSDDRWYYIIKPSTDDFGDDVLQTVDLKLLFDTAV